MNELKILPMFKNLIKPLSENEFKQLEENILEYGCRDPLVILNDNTIIDGHNRYEICNKHNVEFKTVKMEFKDNNEIIAWIITNQLGRRNLNDYQKVILGDKLLEHRKVEAKEKKDSFNGNQFKESPFPISEKASNINTTKEVADITGVSTNTVSQVRKISAEAPEEIKESFNQAKPPVSINKAYNITRLPVSENEKIKIFQEASIKKAQRELKEIDEWDKKATIIMRLICNPKIYGLMEKLDISYLEAYYELVSSNDKYHNREVNETCDDIIETLQTIKMWNYQLIGKRGIK